jgi:16S rRNA (cytidine1402-2'-O)-methyltransferase
VNPERATIGALYLVSTPIGNLEDLSPRARRVLQSVRWIAAEDTRHTRQLMSACDLHTPLISYREQNHRQAAARILECCRAGEDVALVSDAGTPGISDPGQALVAEAVVQGVPVVPVPGPVAALVALSASGLPSDRFLFLGFLPRKPGSLRAVLESVRGEQGSLVMYESPHRVAQTLTVLASVLGPRNAVVARELTKRFEDFQRGTLTELAQRFAAGTRGEVVLVVQGAGGKPEEAVPAPSQVDELIAALRQGTALGAGDVARVLEPLCGLPRRELYRRAAALPGKEGKHGSG